jgi:hypothetical protein
MSNTDPFKVWQIADSLLETKEIEIPYLKTLASLFPTTEERFMRDFDKVISLIKASALWHQFQREETAEGAIVANEDDYRLVYSLADTFTQSVSQVSDAALTFLTTLRASPDMTKDQLCEELKVSMRTLNRYVGQAVKQGFIEVEGRGKNQKFNVIEIPEKQTVLPSPEAIFAKDLEPSPEQQAFTEGIAYFVGTGMSKTEATTRAKEALKLL